MSNWRMMPSLVHKQNEWKFNLLKYSYLRFGFSSLLSFLFLHTQSLSVTLDCCCWQNCSADTNLLFHIILICTSIVGIYGNWIVPALSISCEPTITIDGEGEIQLLSGDDKIFFFCLCFLFSKLQKNKLKPTNKNYYRWVICHMCDAAFV